MDNFTSFGSNLLNISSLCASSEAKIQFIDQITAHTIEAYMNNVVNTVHDFVNKAFILISIALGSLIALMLYMIIVFSNRSRSTNQAAAYDNFEVNKEKAEDEVKPTKRENYDIMTANNDHSYKTSSVANIVSIDERILDEMGFSFQTRDQCSGIPSEDASISNFSSISLCSEEP